MSAALTAQGTSVTIGSGSNAYAAIDTGTTLVGGPSAYIANLYSQIPEATPGTGDYDGYYIYREYFSRTTINIIKHFFSLRYRCQRDNVFWRKKLVYQQRRLSAYPNIAIGVRRCLLRVDYGK